MVELCRTSEFSFQAISEFNNYDVAKHSYTNGIITHGTR